MKIALAAIAAALIGLPYLGLPAFYESFGYLLLSAIVLATSWNLLSGYSGYFSFGHGAFFGVGVYTTAALAGKHGWNFLWTLPLAALAATAPTAGPSQCRVPPSALISTTLTARAIEKVSATVT